MLGFIFAHSYTARNVVSSTSATPICNTFPFNTISSNVDHSFFHFSHCRSSSVSVCFALYAIITLCTAVTFNVLNAVKIKHKSCCNWMVDGGDGGWFAIGKWSGFDVVDGWCGLCLSLQWGLNWPNCIANDEIRIWSLWLKSATLCQLLSQWQSVRIWRYFEDFFFFYLWHCHIQFKIRNNKQS